MQKIVAMLTVRCRKELCQCFFFRRSNDYFLGDFKRCQAKCELGQECQWINGEEMCVCSPESCLTSNQDDQPVCAANNMTFTSTCAMEAWKCLNHQSGLYKKYDGECQSESKEITI